MDVKRAETFYFKELERRRDLDAAPTLRIAALALLGGVFSFYVKVFDLNGGIWSSMFLVCAAVVIVFASLAVIWIMRLFVGYSWGYMPCPDDLGAYFDTLVEYHDKYHPKKTANQMFEAHLRGLFIQAASLNMRNNNARSELLYRASFFLTIAVLLTLISGIPVLYTLLSRTILVP